MKNMLFIFAIFLLACGPSSEKIELVRLRDSIRIMKTMNGGDPNVFDASTFMEVHSSESIPPSAEELAKMEENARRTQDSIANAINASMK